MEPTAEHDFETRLEAMFADPPPAPDAAAFALALERRLEQEARRRRAVYVTCLVGAGSGAAGIFALKGFSADLGGLGALASLDLSWAVQVAPVVIGGFLIWIFTELAEGVRR